MRISTAKIATLAASVFLFAGLSAFGQSIVSVDYTGGYSTTWGNSGGDYGAGIYTATINGVASSSASSAMTSTMTLQQARPGTPSRIRCPRLFRAEISGTPCSGTQLALQDMPK
jgi:hypothetical protein